MIPKHPPSDAQHKVSVSGPYPKVVEDYWQESDGDDWRPALLRIQLESYTEWQPGFIYPFQVPVVFGARGRNHYEFSAHVPISGLRLIAAVPGAVDLTFPNGTDGFRVHFASTPSQVGSAEVQESAADIGELYDLMVGRTASASFEGLTIVGSNGADTFGVMCYRNVTMENCEVRNFGAYGVFVDADVTRGPDLATAQANGGAGNANQSIFRKVLLVANGQNPGVSRFLSAVTADNPTGLNPIGGGMFFRGGDANICLVDSCAFIANAGYAVCDVGFLGNRYINPHADGNVWAADAARLAVPASTPGFWRPGTPAALDSVPLSFYWAGASNRAEVYGPYVESGAPYYVGRKAHVHGPIGGTPVVAGGKVDADAVLGTRETHQNTVNGTRYELQLPINGDSDSEEAYLARLAVEETAAGSRPHLDTAPLKIGLRRYNGDDKASATVHDHRFAGCWTVNYNNTSPAAVAITTAHANTLGHVGRADGRRMLPGRLQVLDFYLERMYFGVTNASALASVDTANLEAGTRLFNNMPSAGAPDYWVWDGTRWLEGPTLSIDQ